MEGAPLTFGALRPTVVLSPGLEGEQLACVLAHEGVHARRRDNLWHYAMALALVVHWWNPAVWLMARLLRRDIELSCDRAAVKKLGTERRADYALALVSLATQGEGPAFSHTFGRKLTEERIRSIMKFKKTSVIGAILSLTLVLALTVAFASEPVEPRYNNVPEYDYAEDGDPVNNGIIGTRYPDYVEEDGAEAAGKIGSRFYSYQVDGGPVRTSSGLYDLCKDQACKVSYDHCHIGGEVVRVYYENPGLLCAHPDCQIEGPHEHDGVQYAGNAPEAYVILGSGDPVPVNSSPIITEQGEPGESAPMRLVTLEEYEALLGGLVSQGKMSREDADWFLDGATRGLLKNERNRLFVTEDGSYAIM